MTQPQRVLYLPEGMVAASAPAAAQERLDGSPFGRMFFEQVLLPSIQSFCSQTSCSMPTVRLTTVDGATHYVVGVSGVADQWVAVHTSIPEHKEPVQMFLPYSSIFRVEIHPEPAVSQRHMGFIVGPADESVPVVVSAKGAKKRQAKGR